MNIEIYLCKNIIACGDNSMRMSEAFIAYGRFWNTFQKRRKGRRQTTINIMFQNVCVNTSIKVNFMNDKWPNVLVFICGKHLLELLQHHIGYLTHRSTFCV